MSKLGVGGGSLIVTGTAIGAGMLGLPVVSAACGFIPALFILVACWGFMCLTGLLYAELACVYKEESNISTMAVRTLGPIGKPLTLVIYLFIFYALTVAYFVGGGNILSTWMPYLSDPKIRILLFAMFLVPVIALGKKVVDPLNKVLMFGLIAAYFGFVCIGASSVTEVNLVRVEWGQSLFVLPVAFASFGYQGTIPTLACWMDYDLKKLKRAIVNGTLLTLFIYAIWVLLIVGIVPYAGKFGLQEALHLGYDAVQPLEYIIGDHSVFTIGRLFAFFAITTSFLGVGIGLVDFLRDAMHIKKVTASKTALLLTASFLLPLAVALSYPHIFLEALGYAGGFGAALLLGALPVVMCYIAKYRHKAPVGDQFFTKKKSLILLLFFAFLEIGCEILHLIISSGR